MRVWSLLLTVLLLIGLLTGCDTQEPVSDAVLMQDGKCLYTIVRSAEASEALVRAVIDFNKAINTKTGTTLPISTDRDAPADGAKEILIGDTNRPETAAVLESLSDNGYAVTIQNDQIVIVGTDEDMTTLALDAFYNTVICNDAQTKAGSMVMSADGMIKKSFDVPLTLEDLIASGCSIRASYEKKFTVTTGKDGYSLQGSATDGTYAYFGFAHYQDNSHGLISKYRLSDGELVKTSESLSIGHTNGIAYDPVEDRLLVIDGPNLKAIDPETLTLTQTIPVPEGNYGVAVRSDGTKTVIHGKPEVLILDRDFQVERRFDKTVMNGYVTQGMIANDQYMFFPYWNKSKDNVLMIYDWEGRYQTAITITINREIESGFWIGDRFYVSFNVIGSGVDELYELTDYHPLFRIDD